MDATWKTFRQVRLRRTRTVKAMKSTQVVKSFGFIAKTLFSCDIVTDSDSKDFTVKVCNKIDSILETLTDNTEIGNQATKMAKEKFRTVLENKTGTSKVGAISKAQKAQSFLNMPRMYS